MELLKSMQQSTDRIVGNTFILMPIAYGLIVDLDCIQTIICAWYPVSSRHHYTPNPDMYYLSAG